MSENRTTEILENVKSLDGDSLVNLAYLHEKVHKGEMLFVNKVFTVANEGVVYIHHVSGSTKYLHSAVEVDSVGAWRFTSYAGTTYIDPGDALPVINRKSDSEYTPEVLFYENVVGDIDVLGDMRRDFAFGTGTNPAKASSGSTADRLESMFEPELDVLVVLTNNSGSEQLLTVTYNFYEEE